MVFKDRLIDKLSNNNFEGFMSEMFFLFNAKEKESLDLEKIFEAEEDFLFYKGKEMLISPSKIELQKNPEAEPFKAIVINDNLQGGTYIKAVVYENQLPQIMYVPKNQVKEMKDENETQ